MSDNDDISQKTVCMKYASVFTPSFPLEKVGIALNTLGQLPLNALRNPAENGTCGWYIWGGAALSQEPNFFQPLHVQHLAEHCPDIIPYLALAPGWRVLLAPNQIDVWFDDGLLNV
jgi:hypothetical protein